MDRNNLILYSFDTKKNYKIFNLKNTEENERILCDVSKEISIVKISYSPIK